MAIGKILRSDNYRYVYTVPLSRVFCAGVCQLSENN